MRSSTLFFVLCVSLLRGVYSILLIWYDGLLPCCLRKVRSAVVRGGQDDVVVGLRSARGGVSQGLAGLERVCVGGWCYSGEFGPCLEK